MKIVLTSIFALALLGCAGCKDCNQPNNPISKDYPCGTRAHACSTSPLMCCWRDEVCGGQVGSGCPEGMCCFVGEDLTAAASPSASSKTPLVAQPGAKQQAQWKP